MRSAPFWQRALQGAPHQRHREHLAGLGLLPQVLHADRVRDALP